MADTFTPSANLGLHLMRAVMDDQPLDDGTPTLIVQPDGGGPTQIMHGPTEGWPGAIHVIRQLIGAEWVMCLLDARGAAVDPALVCAVDADRLEERIVAILVGRDGDRQVASQSYTRAGGLIVWGEPEPVEHLAGPAGDLADRVTAAVRGRPWN